MCTLWRKVNEQSYILSSRLLVNSCFVEKLLHFSVCVRNLVWEDLLRSSVEYYYLEVRGWILFNLYSMRWYINFQSIVNHNYSTALQTKFNKWYKCIWSTNSFILFIDKRINPAELLYKYVFISCAWLLPCYKHIFVTSYGKFLYFRNDPRGQKKYIHSVVTDLAKNIERLVPVTCCKSLKLTKEIIIQSGCQTNARCLALLWYHQSCKMSRHTLVGGGGVSDLNVLMENFNFGFENLKTYSTNPCPHQLPHELEFLMENFGFEDLKTRSTQCEIVLNLTPGLPRC